MIQYISPVYLIWAIVPIILLIICVIMVKGNYQGTIGGVIFILILILFVWGGLSVLYHYNLLPDFLVKHLIMGCI